MPGASSPTLDDLLVSKEFLFDPYPVLHRLRTEDPVHWSDSVGGWILTRYDDIAATFKDVDHYSNEGRLARAVEYLPAESRAKLQTFEDHYRTKGLLHSDPPDHTRLRALVVKSFTAKMVEAMRPRMQATVDALLNASENGRIDIIKDIAVPLPVTILAEILGAPVSDRMLFKDWADDLLAFQGVNKPGLDLLERAQHTLIEIRGYLARLAQDRRRQPREDLMSVLVTAESDGDRLSEPELLNTCITLLVAGHETSTSLIGNGLYTLLHHYEQWVQLQSEQSLLPSAIDEILRYESPVARQPRLMKNDAELAGKQLRRGEVVFQMLNAANRDPAYFEHPDLFDIRRKKNRHIAFGMGIHFCVGAVLARTEADVVFRTFLNRFPGMRLENDTPEWDLTKPNSRMLKRLNVTLD